MLESIISNTGAFLCPERALFIALAKHLASCLGLARGVGLCLQHLALYQAHTQKGCTSFVFSVIRPSAISPSMPSTSIY